MKYRDPLFLQMIIRTICNTLKLIEHPKKYVILDKNSFFSFNF